MSIFRTFDDVLAYIRANGKFIGQKMMDGDASASFVTLRYADWRINSGAEEADILWKALEEHTQKWTRTQICRICCERLDCQWQHVPHQSGYFLMTCRNTACAMCGYTLSSQDYSTMALNPYLKGKVAWRWDYDAVVEATRQYYPLDKGGWQRQARSIRRLVQRQEVGVVIYDQDTTERAIAAVKIHKTPEGEVPF